MATTTVLPSLKYNNYYYANDMNDVDITYQNKSLGQQLTEITSINIDTWVKSIIQSLFQQTGVFANIAGKDVDKNSLEYKIVILYLRVLYCKEKFNTETNPNDKERYLGLFTTNAIGLLTILPEYYSGKPAATASQTNTDALPPVVAPATTPATTPAPAATAGQPGVQGSKSKEEAGGSKKQKGGMDTAKIYNAQGNIQEMAAFNRSNVISPAMNFPAPFSVSTYSTVLSGTVDTLPPEAIKALLPPLSGGKKKKVKRT